MLLTLKHNVCHVPCTDTNTPTQPFLRHAIELLKIHGDDLLVRPASDDAQTRCRTVRRLLQNKVEPISDTAAVLQCPLSEEVLTSLELSCTSEKAEIVRKLNHNCLLTDARVHLEHLRLLYDALRLPQVELSYTSGLHEMVSQAENRKQMALEALQKQSFSQVRSFLSIFNCDVSILSSHMEKIGDRDVLKIAKSACLNTINTTCDAYDSQLDQALDNDDFCSVVTVLTNCEGMLGHLKEYVSSKRQDMISVGAIEKVRKRTLGNSEKATDFINNKRFDAELGFLLDAIISSSENEALIRHVMKYLEMEFPAGESDYVEVLDKLNTTVIDVADKLTATFKSDARLAFVEEARETADALAQIDAAEDNLGKHHLGQQARDSRIKCREAFVTLKDKTFEQLRIAIEMANWQEASFCYDYMKSAATLGSVEERRSVQVRLVDMQNSAHTNLCNLVDSLSTYLERDDFQGFMKYEGSLGTAKLLPDSVLCQASLDKFNSDHVQLLSRVNEKFTQTAEQCRDALNQHKYREMVAGITVIEDMAEASVGLESESGCAVPDFNSRVAELLKDVKFFAKREVDECQQLAAHFDISHLPTEADVAELNKSLQKLQQLKKQVDILKGKVPNLGSILDPCELFPVPKESLPATPRGSQSKGRRQKKRTNTTADTPDFVTELFRMLETAEDALAKCLQAYASACRERCLSSLAAEPKPRANDVVVFMKTLTVCQVLDAFFAAASPDAGRQPFAEQRKAVSAAVKQKVMEVHDECGRDVRADKMADAKAKLDISQEMLVFADEFAGDARSLNALVEEMQGNFNQKAGAFRSASLEALNQERFTELNKLLVGYRHLSGAAEQEEYNCAMCKLKEVGDEKYTFAMQIISSSITDDPRGRHDFPPGVEQMATALRWIEAARCLGDGDDPILPREVYATWHSAIDNMKSKLELLKARESKLDEWKFATVEEMHRRFSQLLMLRFPVEISESINKMRLGLSEALEAKVNGLDDDVMKALKEADYQTIDLIFSQVKQSKDADSYFVNHRKYISLFTVLENFLNELVDSIKEHYMKLEIREAHLKQEHLWKLEKASIARNQVAHAGLDVLAEQKKKNMITRSYLTAGYVREVKAKINGFREVDPVKFQSLMGDFMESIDSDIKRLRKVETKQEVNEVGQVVLDLPRFATILDSEQHAFEKSWKEIWNSFFEAIDKKLRLASLTTSGHEQDVSDSISFLRAARKLLQQNVTASTRTSFVGSLPKHEGTGSLSAPSGGSAKVLKQVPGKKVVNQRRKHAGSGAAGGEGGGGEGVDGRGAGVLKGSDEDTQEALVQQAAVDKSPAGGMSSLLFAMFKAPVTPTSGSTMLTGPPAGTTVIEVDTGDAGNLSDDDFEDAEEFVDAETLPAEEIECVFSFPFDNAQVKDLIEKLDGLLGHIEVDVCQIDADWKRCIDNFDCKTEAASFVDTLHFIRQLKRQSQAILTCGDYLYGQRLPTTDRALAKISATASVQVKALDTSTPEECVIVWHNLHQFVQECFRVIDDDVDLQNTLTENMTKHVHTASERVMKLEKNFVQKTAQHYAEAQKQYDPKKRKAALCEVTKNMELHKRLQDKLVEHGIRGQQETDTPLVADIKKQITEMEASTTSDLRMGKCAAEDVAESIHRIYMTASDLGDSGIMRHSESCIGIILKECTSRKAMNKFGLEEVGAVLERGDFPQGSEIVAHLPQFAELNLLAFQKMTTGKTPQAVVKEVVELNNLPKTQAETLHRAVQEVFTEYEHVVTACRFQVDFARKVSDLKRNYEIFHSLPKLIGGVFAIWSLASKSEQFSTPRMPLPVQVVAIVRLLALDRPAPRGYLDYVSRWLTSETPSVVDASHLAQIRTGQGKSVVLGTLATVLSLAGFSVDCVWWKFSKSAFY